MESFAYVILGVGAIFCAYRTTVSTRLLSCTLYLACISASTSVILYLLGAQQVAAIELSVGAGLVTVLLVYALSVVGDDAHDLISELPKPLAFAIVGAAAILLWLMAYPLAEPSLNVASDSLTVALWHQRVLDVWIQIALIFSGVLGVLGLLSEAPAHVDEVHS